MIKCTNCSNTFSCGCKKRQATDGKSCCTACVSQYESSIKKSKPDNRTPINVKATGTLGS